MSTDHRAALANIRRFDQLIAYLRDEMGWPISRESFEDAKDLFFDFTADELGIEPKTAAKIESIKRLRPLSARQPWGIFFVKFEPKRLPVVALRRILGQVAVKKRASANSAERIVWAADDLLFVSNYGEGDERQISFAHFSKAPDGQDLPTLKVLGWDNRDTALHLDAVVKGLTQHLSWPNDDKDVEAWSERWRGAFTLGHREVISTSRELSMRLAELARAIRDIISATLAIETERGPLTRLMTAFREALVHDLDPEGFADMYAQTIAYGLLSARITSPEKTTADDFVGHMHTNPFLRELMETFLQVGGRRGKAGGPGIDFDELGVSEVVQLLDDANMEAVVRDFGDRNPQEDPVIHFYELFLREYDAKKRMQRGVFYTPRSVVSYIVRSVDDLLRTRFALADGLADTTTWAQMGGKGVKTPDGVSPDQDFVQILDPACGTGTFLVEAIDLIHKTLVAKWKAQGNEKKLEALWNEYVPKHLLPRLHGYELLMAPYAIAHLKIGLKLHETGYRFGSSERARIYLTNALESPRDTRAQTEFKEWIPALAHEANAVNAIKRDQRFTVVIGNPPYASTSSNLTPELRQIVDPYRSVDGQRIHERSMLQFEKNIQDDYVKFLAFSQARLEEASCGILSLITNHSYLDGPTLRGVRWNLASQFQNTWFLDLHGNANKAEVAPEGISDENVFDIRQGVAICVLMRDPDLASPAHRYVGELWGVRSAKYKQLSALTVTKTDWVPIEIAPPYYYLVKPDSGEGSVQWAEWPAVGDLLTKRSTGTETGFDDLMVNFTKLELTDRVERFADRSGTRQSLSNEFDFSDGHAAALFARRKELRTVTDEEYRPFQLRPFDYRWALMRKNMLKTNSFNVMLDLHDGSPGLVTTRQTKEKFTAFAVKTFCGHKLTSSYDRSYVLPLFTTQEGELFSHEATCLDRKEFDMFRAIAGRDTPDRELSLDIFRFVIATLNAPSYNERFAQRLKRDWPRVPRPRRREVFYALAGLGGELVAIHLMESPKLDHLITTYAGPRNPEVGRVAWSDEAVWLDSAPTKKGDLASSAATSFRGVPKAVWNFRVGGYQVCEKWLKDRRGRTLSKDDIRHYQKIVVAVSESIRLLTEIDVTIEQHGGWLNAFAASSS
jgi:hypothetical protein